jgi:hypothetical protein
MLPLLPLLLVCSHDEVKHPHKPTLLGERVEDEWAEREGGSQADERSEGWAAYETEAGEGGKLTGDCHGRDAVKPRWESVVWSLESG